MTQPLHLLLSCKNSCYREYNQWTSDAQDEACVYDHGASWPCPPVMPGCCGVALHSLESQLCNQTVRVTVLMWEPMSEVLHTHLHCCISMVLPESGTGSDECELFVQGEEDALFAHLPLFPTLVFLLTGGDLWLHCVRNPLVYLVSFRHLWKPVDSKERS